MAVFSQECFLYIDTVVEKAHNSTVGLLSVHVGLDAVRTKFTAKLMSPTLQPMNANQNDKHVTVLGQLYTTC